MVPVRKRFTREEVNRLLDTDIFAGQRFELIDGELINKMGQSPPHAYAIQLVSKWLRNFFDADNVSVQFPVELPGADGELSVPEPDVALLKQWMPEYERRHPTAPELLLAVEISDTTAAFDLERKAVLYARSGVPEYWVLDLNRRMLVAHRQPDGEQYRLIRLFSEEEGVSLENRNETVKVADLLPARA